MEKSDRTSFWMLVLLAVSVCLNFIQWHHGKCVKLEVRTDTVEVVSWDTLHDSVPEIRYEWRTRYVPIPDSIIITDTVTGESVLPIVQRTYTDDSTYTVYVSGAKIDSFPRLDSIDISMRTLERTVTKTVYRNKSGLSVKMRPALSSGYDPFNRNWGVMIGGAVVLDW